MFYLMLHRLLFRIVRQNLDATHGFYVEKNNDGFVVHRCVNVVHLVGFIVLYFMLYFISKGIV